MGLRSYRRGDARRAWRNHASQGAAFILAVAAVTAAVTAMVVFLS